MAKVVVVRVGTPNYNWDTKWSSPEMPGYANNQTVLDLYVEQFPIIVVFVTTGNIPLYIASVDAVRPRDNLLDYQYPLGNASGLFQTFITFQRKYLITSPAYDLLKPMLNSIRYIPGQQVTINDNLALAAVLIYSIYTVNLTNPILNTTYINPAYF